MTTEAKDFFISYTQKDKQWAEWIAGTLEMAGYTTIIQAWDFKSGENFVLNMDKALKQSKRFIAVLSNAYLESLYCQAEWTAAFTKDPNMEQASFIPVRIEEMKIEGLLAPVAYIDLVGKNEEEAEKELLEGVFTEGRPRIRPPYPGTKRVRFPGKLSFSNLPERRNPHFTGRQEILEGIHKTFETKETIALTQAIAGLGGIGKTQVALEYVYRYGYEYDQIWWVNAETDETILASFLNFAIKNKIIKEDTKEAEIIIEAVRDWMQQYDNWLFIFDNVEKENKLQRFLPAQSFGRRHVLVTSRSPRFLRCLPINIGVFTEFEACKFIEKYTQKPADEYFKELAKKMGYLPLALDQAGAYMKIHRMNYKEYLDLYKKHHLELLSEYDDDPDKKTVATTWTISFDAITNKASQQLLNLCAFFAPDNIFTELFTVASDVLPDELREAVTNKLKYIKTRDELTKYSLVTLNDDNTLSIHRLVQEVIRDNLKQEQTKWHNLCIQLLNKLRYDDFSTPESRTRFLALAPHFVSVTTGITDEEETEEISLLYHFLGWGFNELADYDQALEYYGKALDIVEKVLGKEHPDTATTYNNIAGVYDNKGDKDSLNLALEYHRKALGTFEKVFGKKHLMTKLTFNNMSEAYRKSGNPESFEDWLEGRRTAISEA